MTCCETSWQSSSVHAALFVDVDPQQVRASLSAIVDVDELQPFGFDDPLDLLLDPLR